MRILAVSPVNPYPPADGDSVRIYNLLRGLKERGHMIHLVFLSFKEDAADSKELKKICDSYESVKISRSGVMVNAVKAVFQAGAPINAKAYYFEHAQQAVNKAHSWFKPDITFAYRLRGALYAQQLPGPAACDAVDSLALHSRRKLLYETNLLKKIYLLLDTGRLKKFENGLSRRFFPVIYNFEEDTDYAAGTLTVANGAQQKGAGQTGKKVNDFTLGFFGNLKYHPNADGIRWFFKFIWKKVHESDKNIKLKVFGDPGNLVFPKGAESAGYVPEKDFDKAVASLSAVIVPVRYGTGRQNKIMRAWANSVPVIGTSYSARGVYGKQGLNMLIAQGENAFANAIVTLKNDSSLARRLTAGGLRTLKEKFSWKNSVQKLEAELKKAIRRKK